MIDEKYTNLLKANNSLSLKECLWLDAVQKHLPITKEVAKHLHEKGLIEGRAPHYTISLKVAKMTKQIGHYTKENGLAENSIQKLLLQLLIMQEVFHLKLGIKIKLTNVCFCRLIMTNSLAFDTFLSTPMVKSCIVI